MLRINLDLLDISFFMIEFQNPGLTEAGNYAIKNIIRNCVKQGETYV